MVFVLAGMDVFFNRGIFVIDVFSHAIMDEACGATNVLLTAVVTCKLVYCITKQYTSLRVTTAVNNTLVAPHASSMIA